jgi:hypothetical protein
MVSPMNKHLTALAVALLLLSSSLSAQAAWNAPTYNWGSDWCVDCHTTMNVDSPNLAGWNGVIAGWGFWCSTGELPTRHDVYYRNATGLFRAQTYWAAHGAPRPDVFKYFTSSGVCPNAPVNSGWTIGFTKPIPSGTWTMSVVLWHGNVSTTQTGVVVVP